MTQKMMRYTPLSYKRQAITRKRQGGGGSYHIKADVGITTAWEEREKAKSISFSPKNPSSRKVSIKLKGTFLLDSSEEAGKGKGNGRKMFCHENASKIVGTNSSELKWRKAFSFRKKKCDWANGTRCPKRKTSGRKNDR